MQPQYIPLNGRAKDLSGQRFGRLVALGPIGHTHSRLILWLCQCDCGRQRDVVSSSLLYGSTRSCGCILRDRPRRSVARNRRKHPLYHAWWLLNVRCDDKRCPAYPDYGGRGITVFLEWRTSFDSFLAYVATLADYLTPGYSLDRIDNDGDYVPGNLRWASQAMQQRNTRKSRILSFGGKQQSLAAWAEEIGLPQSVIRNRLVAGWSIERALTMPVAPRQPRSPSPF